MYYFSFAVFFAAKLFHIISSPFYLILSSNLPFPVHDFKSVSRLTI